MQKIKEVKENKENAKNTKLPQLSPENAPLPDIKKTNTSDVVKRIRTISTRWNVKRMIQKRIPTNNARTKSTKRKPEKQHQR